MTKREDEFLYEASSYLFSLSKFVGKKIVDVVGYPYNHDGTPVFKISQIVFENDSVWVEGEHDIPYLPADNTLQNMDEDTLERFYAEEEDE